MIREFLVTKFICAKCGANLRIEKSSGERCTKFAEGEPTGAAMVELSVFVHPCECITRETETIRSAISTLVELAK